MPGTLPPPPIGEPPGSFAWQQWYTLLGNLYSVTGAIPWDSIDTTGSDLTDLATRTHNSLQTIQGGTSGEYYHLTSADHTGTGTGVVVRKTGAALITPDIGVATGTSLQAIIGNVTPAAGTFTALTATGAVTLGDNAADIMTMTSDKIVTSLAGGLNLPLQSSFSAYLSATQTNQTGAGTAYTIIFDTEIADQNADYDTSTGVFTAPVTGRYLFSCSALMIGATISTGSTLTLTTSNRSWVLNGTSRPAGTPDMYSSGSAIVDMDASDTAKINIAAFGEVGNTVDIYGSGSPIFTWFTGQLIA